MRADTPPIAGDFKRASNLSFDTAKQTERSFQIMGTAGRNAGRIRRAMVEMVDKTTSSRFTFSTSPNPPASRRRP